MSELHFDWLEFSIAVPAFGAIWLSRVRDADHAHRICVALCSLTLFAAVGAWADFRALGTPVAHDRWDLFVSWSGATYLQIDHLNAPLLPLAALLYSVMTLATPRSKIRRFSFVGALASEAILLATFCSTRPWLLAGLMAAGIVHPMLELRQRGRSTRVLVLHMGLFIALLVLGTMFLDGGTNGQTASLLALAPLLVAILIRAGIAPFHCWMTDLFDKATFGTALLFVAPMQGAYLAARLVLPVAPSWVLHGIGLLSLVTAVYAAGMALIQREARRFFCYLFLSHSSLVLVGLESATPLGLTGALCVWLSVVLALTGFGLTLRSMEARMGRISLDSFQGYYEHTPTLAVFFLLTGLASVGFPGTFGFVGAELLVDGAVHAFPHVGVAVIVAAALNGIAVLQAYFRLFTGARHVSSIPLHRRPRENFAVLLLAALIFLGGLVPQPIVELRHRAADAILAQRQSAEQARSIASTARLRLRTEQRALR